MSVETFTIDVATYVAEATEHYLLALLWTSSCGGEVAAAHECFGEDVCDSSLLDIGFDADDFTPRARELARVDVAAFVDANYLSLATTVTEPVYWTAEQCGHDFLLTRNGHGAGFRDRGAGERGDRLADAARVYGETYAYVTADDKVEIQ